jgi:hypothetical protein
MDTTSPRPENTSGEHLLHYWFNGRDLQESFPGRVEAYSFEAPDVSRPGIDERTYFQSTHIAWPPGARFDMVTLHYRPW